MTAIANLLVYLLPLLPSIPDVEPAEAEMLFAGDAMMHAAQIDASRTPQGHDFSGYFDDVKEYIGSADFAVVNFEASLGGKPYKGYPCFSAPDEYPHALVNAGFDFFLLANNHILDRQDKGLHRTIARLDSLRIPHTGIYHDSAARDSLVPALVNVNGFRVALLNYTYGTNGFEVKGPAVVDYINNDKIAADVRSARNHGAELVCVCIHWGDEYKLLPNASQKRMADVLTEMGVDMIIGGHPHVIQPMEMRRGPEGRPVLLVYSLGNFISNMKTDDTRGGAMVRVTLKRDSTGRAIVGGASYALVFTEPASAKGENFRLRPAHKSTHHKAAIFRQNAEAIFRKHNIGIGADSLFIQNQE